MFARLLVVAALLASCLPATAQTGPAPTTTSLVSSANPSTYGNSVTFTVSVASDTGTPTGNVAFYDGEDLFAGASLNADGVATFSTTFLAVNDHTISARYVGEGLF